MKNNLYIGFATIRGRSWNVSPKNTGGTTVLYYIIPYTYEYLELYINNIQLIYIKRVMQQHCQLQRLCSVSDTEWNLLTGSTNPLKVYINKMYYTGFFLSQSGLLTMVDGTIAAE
jgi:hypothetical protein